MSIAFGGALAITPFALLRLLQADWMIAIVDCSLVAGMLVLGSYVYRTHQIDYPSLILSLLGMLGMSLVVYLKGIMVVFWAYPACIAVYYLLRPRLALVLTMLTITFLVPAIYDATQLMLSVAVIMTLAVNNLFTYVFATRMSQQRDQLTRLIRLDPLTGVGNRRALNEKLEELLALYLRNQQMATLIVLDIDHFKSINDGYGHAVGDQVLVKTTEMINARIRVVDNLYRFGGEEFVLVVLGADQQDAFRVAEQLRLNIEATEMLKNHRVTVSMGVAQIQAEETAAQWMERGDKAMYQAKSTGRNRTCIAPIESQASPQRTFTGGQKCDL